MPSVSALLPKAHACRLSRDIGNNVVVPSPPPHITAIRNAESESRALTYTGKYENSRHGNILGILAVPDSSPL